MTQRTKVLPRIGIVEVKTNGEWERRIAFTDFKAALKYAYELCEKGIEARCSYLQIVRRGKVLAA